MSEYFQVHAEQRAVPDKRIDAGIQPLSDGVQCLDVPRGIIFREKIYKLLDIYLQGWGFYMTGEYNWVCQPVDYGTSPLAKRALNLAWWYYFSKVKNHQAHVQVQIPIKIEQ